MSEATPKRENSLNKYVVKGFVIVQPEHFFKEGEANISIAECKAGRRAAEAVQKKIPGSSILKLTFDKSEDIRSDIFPLKLLTHERGK
jgi:hypothetical protein